MNLAQIGSELVAAYAELKHFLLRRLRNADDAADVAQASFERVYAYALAAPVASWKDTASDIFVQVQFPLHSRRLLGLTL